eukprot:205234_1
MYEKRSSFKLKRNAISVGGIKTSNLLGVKWRFLKEHAEPGLRGVTDSNSDREEFSRVSFHALARPPHSSSHPESETDENSEASSDSFGSRSRKKKKKRSYRMSQEVAQNIQDELAEFDSKFPQISESFGAIMGQSDTAQTGDSAHGSGIRNSLFGVDSRQSSTEASTGRARFRSSVPSLYTRAQPYSVSAETSTDSAGPTPAPAAARLSESDKRHQNAVEEMARLSLLRAERKMSHRDKSAPSLQVEAARLASSQSPDFDLSTPKTPPPPPSEGDRPDSVSPTQSAPAEGESERGRSRTSGRVGDKGRERSQSPVIVWRPSARVKIAEDLPVELKSVFRDETPVDVEKRTLISEPQSHLKAWDEVHQKHKQQHSGRFKFNISPTKRKARLGYGAWYIHPSKWEYREKTEDKKQLKRVSPVIEERVKELTSEIPSKFIAKAYKRYIMRECKNNRTVPTYLEKTEELVIKKDKNDPRKSDESHGADADVDRISDMDMSRSALEPSISSMSHSKG